MARAMVVATLLLALAACDGKAPETPSDSDGGPTARSAAEVDKMLVGTWDYGRKYRSGDVVEMVRVFEEDGTGSQYTKDAGPDTAQAFRWTVGEDGKTVTLTYGEATTVAYDVESLADGKLTMKPRTAAESFPEVCVRR